MAGTKKHAASTRKVRKAREEGQVASKRALIHVLALIVVLEATVASASIWWQALVHPFEVMLVRAVESPELGYVVAAESAASGGVPVLALFGLAALTAVSTGFLLNGFLFAPKAVEPRLERLNPVAMVKNTFGARGWSIFFLGLVKLVVFLTFAFLQLRGNLPQLADVWRVEGLGTGPLLAQAILPVMRTGEAVLLVSAAIEAVLEHVHHARSQRMDDEELKRDYRESTGDPHQKAMRRALAQMDMMSSPAGAEARPDVVLANPTHYAVALQYRRGEDAAPRVLTKHRDRDALRLIETSCSEGVTVIRSPAFTRALFRASTVGAEVPASFYPSIAVLYRLLEELDPSQRGSVIDVPGDFLEVDPDIGVDHEPRAPSRPERTGRQT